MSDLTDTDFPPLEPPPFVTEEGREIERLRDELSKKVGELAAMKQQRDEARREACHLEAVRSFFLGFQKNIKDHAAQRGWDCFAQKEGGGA